MQTPAAAAAAAVSGRCRGRSRSPEADGEVSPASSRSPNAAGSPTAAVPVPGCPITALTLLHSCAVSPSALDAVRCYQPWCGVRPSGGLDGDLADERAATQPPSGMPSAMYSAALCGFAGRIEDAFSPLPLGLPLPLPLHGAGGASRRPRSEKKPTPEDQKDQRYLERRRRNNRAAKKSRDARRAREDQVALRAALLEHENAVLRAQVMTLREETHSLRQLLVHGKGLQQLQQLQQLRSDMVRI